MRFLVLGVNGMAGHVIATYLQERGHVVVGFARKANKCCNTIIGDAEQISDLRIALDAEGFDFVINCIGVLNDAVDKKLSRGIYLNSMLPHLLAELLEDRSTKLMHISTDCVFSSDKVYYTEDSFPNAETYYGKTKALGEVVDNKNLTIRTSIVGPEMKKDGTGLFHWFMNQSSDINGYVNAIWTGITTIELAKAIEYICVNRSELAGIINLVNNSEISKYELLKLFNYYFKNNKTVINKDEQFICCKRLKATREDVGYRVAAYTIMVEDMRNWIYSHKELYPQYFVRDMNLSP